MQLYITCRTPKNLTALNTDLQQYQHLSKTFTATQQASLIQKMILLGIPTTYDNDTIAEEILSIQLAYSKFQILKDYTNKHLENTQDVIILINKHQVKVIVAKGSIVIG